MSWQDDNCRHDDPACKKPRPSARLRPIQSSTVTTIPESGKTGKRNAPLLRRSKYVDGANKLRCEV